MRAASSKRLTFLVLLVTLVQILPIQNTWANGDSPKKDLEDLLLLGMLRGVKLATEHSNLSVGDDIRADETKFDSNLEEKAKRVLVPAEKLMATRRGAKYMGRISLLSFAIGIGCFVAAPFLAAGSAAALFGWLIPPSMFGSLGIVAGKTRGNSRKIQKVLEKINLAIASMREGFRDAGFDTGNPQVLLERLKKLDQEMSQFFEMNNFSFASALEPFLTCNLVLTTPQQKLLQAPKEQAKLSAGVP